MVQKRLNLYTVNIKYVRNLQNQGDGRVFSVSPQVGKETRPFVGIIVICNNKQYCVPLSSPKEKHRQMKNAIDFHRIIDTKGKLIGVLDFNNMIPVSEEVISVIDIKVYPYDNEKEIKYKKLVIDQLNFCRQNQDIKEKKANKLYGIVNKKNISGQLKRRCLNWQKLEVILDKYISNLKED